MNKIAILMSTYNGEKFIREQLDSLYKQTYKSFDIFIRDDGSTDGTISIIKDYQKKYGNITLFIGEANLKPAKSFMQLINLIDSSYDYYSFCDQDDVWLENKIELAVDALQNTTGPCVYCSNYQLVDSNLNPLPDNGHLTSTDFFASIVFSNATGCTMVFNKELFKILHPFFPEHIVMHDDWCHKVCLSIGGKAIYDSRRTILYRQHSANADGGIHSFSHKVRLFFKRFLKKDRVFSKQWLEIVDFFGDIMPQEYKKVLDDICNSHRSRSLRKKVLSMKELSKIDAQRYKKFKYAITYRYY